MWQVWQVWKVWKGGKEWFLCEKEIIKSVFVFERERERERVESYKRQVPGLLTNIGLV